MPDNIFFVRWFWISYLSFREINKRIAFHYCSTCKNDASKTRKFSSQLTYHQSISKSQFLVDSRNNFFGLHESAPPFTTTLPKLSITHYYWSIHMRGIAPMNFKCWQSINDNRGHCIQWVNLTSNGCYCLNMTCTLQITYRYLEHWRNR